MHQQISAILGILADIKSLNSQSLTEEQESVQHIFLQYSKTQN